MPVGRCGMLGVQLAETLRRTAPSIKTNWRERSPYPPCARLAQSQLRDADKALLTQYADDLDREADALERLAASIGFLLSPRADQCKGSSSRLTPRLRPTCQRKQSSFVQCGASRAKAATSLAQRRGRRQAAAVKPEDIGPGLVTSSAGKLASDTQRDSRAPLLHARAAGSVDPQTCT